MPTSSNRDVRLGVQIETAGDEQIRSLAKDVRALAKEGTDAAPEFLLLAEGLDRLAAQATELQAFKTLAADLDRLTEAQRETAAASQAVGAKLTEQQAITERLRVVQTQAAAELRVARQARDDLNASIQRAVIEGKNAGESEDAYAARVRESRLQLVDQRVAVNARRDALTDAKAAVRAAAAEESELSKQYDRVEAAARKAARALTEQEGSLRDQRASAEALGVDLADLAVAEQRLVDATQEYVTKAADRQAALLRDQAQAAGLARVAAEGLAEAQRRSGEAAQQQAAEITRSKQAIENFGAALRQARQADEELGRAEGAAAVKRLEQAATRADAEMRDLVASLRQAEAAAIEYASATDKAAAASNEDVGALEQRRRAATALIEAERALTAAQREVANQRDRGRAGLVAEAQAYLASARAADESLAATRRLVSEARSAGQVLDSAFGRTGVRSLQAIEAEIQDVDRATALLQRRFQGGEISAQDLARALSSAQVRLATLKREMNTVPALPGAFERINQTINGVIGRFGALSAAIATVGIAVRPVLEAEIALEQMRRVLTQVTGSAEVAGQQIEFLRGVSQRSGQSFTEVGQSYAKFAASALQTGLSLKVVDETFESVALAAGNLGLSSDQSKRALEALSQIAAKGTANMEELRQQLGDALPGVLPLLAKELGLTTAELNKVVESGQLLAAEAIPAIGRALKNLGPQDGIVTGLVATWGRFKNIVTEAATALVEGPLGSVVGTGLQAFAGAIRDVAVVAVSANEAFKLFGLSVLSVLDALAGNLTFDQLRKQISDFAVQAGENIQNFKDRAYGAAEGMRALGNAAGFTGESFAKLSLEQQRAIDSAVLTAQVAEKNVQAKKAEAEASAQLATLTGNETLAKEAARDAAIASAEASERLAVADRAVVAALEASKAAILEKVAAGKLEADAVKTVVLETDKKIAKATADVEKSEAQARAARAQADALDVAAGSIRNNADRLGELREEVERLEAAYKASLRALVKDVGTQRDAEKAAAALAKAKGLLKDAIDDVSEALDQQLKLLKSEIDLQKAGLQLELERAKNDERKARENGREIQARQALIRVKELEQQIDILGLNLKTRSAEATLKALDIQERELRSLGLLTPEKENEIRVRRNAALATVLETSATEEGNKSKVEEVRNLKLGRDAKDSNTAAAKTNTSATNENTGAVLKNSSARSENAGEISKQASELERYNDLLAKDPSRLVGGSGLGGIVGAAGSSPLTGVRGVDGVRNAGGPDNRLAADGGTDFSVLGPNKLTQPEFGIASQYTPPDDSGDWYFDVDAWRAAGGVNAGFTNEAARRFWKRKSLADQRAANSRTGTGGSTPFGGPAGAPATAYPINPNGGRTVTVNLQVSGGAAIPLTGGESDVDRLLRELEEQRINSGGGA